MIDLKEKIKKMSPIIKSKQRLLDQQSLLLSQIRERKMLALKQLEKYQNEYIKGVEYLNQARTSPHRDQADVLEQSVDHAKSQWYRSLKEVRRMEEKERSQLSHVVKAQQSLRSVEYLKEKYEESLFDFAKKQEQKQMDEIASQNYFRQKNGS